MPSLHLPADAEVVENRLHEPHADGGRVLLLRTAAVEVTASYDAQLRRYSIHGYARQRGYIFAVRGAPHVRGAAIIAAALARRGVP